MATNARGHTVPSAGETPSRAAIFQSLMTVNDIVPVANATARAQKLLDLGSSAARPLIVRQSDTGVYWEHDGTAWRALGGGGTAPRVVARNGDGGAMPSGVVPLIQSWVTQDARNSAGIMTVVYPQPFSVRPIVIAKTVSGASTDPVINADSANATSVSLIWPGASGGSVRVHLIAIGW